MKKQSHEVVSSTSLASRIEKNEPPIGSFSAWLISSIPELNGLRPIDIIEGDDEEAKQMFEQLLIEREYPEAA